MSLTTENHQSAQLPKKSQVRNRSPSPTNKKKTKKKRHTLAHAKAGRAADGVPQIIQRISARQEGDGAHGDEGDERLVGLFAEVQEAEEEERGADSEEDERGEQRAPREGDAHGARRRVRVEGRLGEAACGVRVLGGRERGRAVGWGLRRGG